MIAFIREMRSKLSSITISNCPGRLSVFTVQRCRELWTGVTPGWLRRVSFANRKPSR